MPYESDYVFEAAERLERERISIGHYDMRFAKPLDTRLVDEALAGYDHLITLEDGTRLGGFGSAVAEYAASKPGAAAVTIMGVPDRVMEHGTQRQLHDEAGIGPDGIVAEVKKVLGVLTD
jgi:1-deoxy-D-xylulose-5-phosphate synthase